ncbi:hypothetical protein DBR43_04445 [Pedobacter sp. KBW06]|uniref:ATP-binding protein n=1 Tax=Pedobacter sp. KBW06 TaxID=2153359 RepID=UPI000F5A141A|nr:ATP-binding protein [Pedobacter sp. KBW06]RQO74641.1 hypothetical protein DBR43_04445 [Pedobacter sp. KBW06]
MNIASLIRYDYASLDGYQGVHIARGHMAIANGLVVLDENIPVGVLTSVDLARKHHMIIMDCLSPKPTVDKADKISKVLDVMKGSGHDVLMVYDQQVFLGTISQHDILNHLHANLNRQRLSLQSVAHDLRSPIASIKMLGNMLQENLILVENKQLVDYLNQSCDFAQKIIEDILLTEQTFEEMVNYSIENFDELVEECAAGLSTELEKKQLVLQTNLKFGKSVKMDRPKFKRAIYNLISNSIKFTNQHGKIELSTVITDNMLKLVVKDNGIGIPENIQGQIFDKFTRAKRPGTAGEPTTGLGMYLTKRIVELHDGSIQVESDGKNGTSFSIFLPL